MQRAILNLLKSLPAMIGAGTSFVDVVSPYLQLIALILGIALTAISFMVKFEDWKLKRIERLENEIHEEDETSP